MNRYERAVINAAKSWWREHRPITFSLKEHLANPTINARYTLSAKRLAKAVGKLREKVKS